MYEPLFHVVLYQPEIPPNTGNIGRTCVAMGGKLWLIEPLGFQIDEKQLRRAGLDYWQHLNWQRLPNWAALLAEPELQAAIAARRMWLITKKGHSSHYEAAFQPGDIFVFGSESSGLPEELLAEHAERTLRIPMRPEVRSLNLSAAAGIVLYEAVRQVDRAQTEHETFGQIE